MFREESHWIVYTQTLNLYTFTISIIKKQNNKENVSFLWITNIDTGKILIYIFLLLQVDFKWNSRGDLSVYVVK